MRLGVRLLLRRARRREWFRRKPAVKKVRLAARAVALAKTAQEAGAALVTLAHTHRYAGEPGQAEAAARRALETIAVSNEQQRAEAQVELAGALLDQDRTDEALVAARRAAEQAAAFAELRARALRMVGASLSKLDESEAAVASLQEAARLYGRLSMTGKFRAYVEHGQSRVLLVQHLRQTGRYQEAIETGKDVAEMWGLFAAFYPAWALPFRANAHMNISVSLASSGATTEAIKAAGQAIADLRRLGNQQPALAYMLACRSDYLADAERYADAAVDIAEAVALYEKAEAEEPSQHRHELVGAMSAHTDDLWRAGQFDASIKVSHEYLPRLRSYARQDTILASALARYVYVDASRLGQLGRASEALPLAEEAVELYASGSPAADELNQARALFLLSLLLADTGDIERCIDCEQKAAALLRGLPNADEPGCMLLAVVLHNLAVDIGSQHRHTEAIELLTESIALRQQFGRADAELARSYYQRASDHHALWNHDLAKADARTAVELATANPELAALARKRAEQYESEPSQRDDS